jgi:hypothetical protein
VGRGSFRMRLFGERIIGLILRVRHPSLSEDSWTGQDAMLATHLCRVLIIEAAATKIKKGPPHAAAMIQAVGEDPLDPTTLSHSDSSPLLTGALVAGSTDRTVTQTRPLQRIAVWS